jgi:hypothetical protein
MAQTQANARRIARPHAATDVARRLLSALPGA